MQLVLTLTLTLLLNYFQGVTGPNLDPGPVTMYPVLYLNAVLVLIPTLALLIYLLNYFQAVTGPSLGPGPAIGFPVLISGYC